VPVLPLPNPLHRLGERANAEREVAINSRPSTSEAGVSREWDRTSPYPAREKLIEEENAHFLRHWMSYEEWFSREASRRESELKAAMVKVNPSREGRWHPPISEGANHAQTSELQREVRELAFQSALDIRAQYAMRPGSAANADAWGMQSIFGGEYLRFSGLLQDPAGLQDLLRFLKSDFKGDRGTLMPDKRSAIRAEGPPGLAARFASTHAAARINTQLRREKLDILREKRRAKLQEMRDRIACTPSNPRLRAKAALGGFELPDGIHNFMRSRVMRSREAKVHDSLLKQAVKVDRQYDLQRKKLLTATMRAEHVEEMAEVRLMLEHRAVSAKLEVTRAREEWGLSTGSYLDRERTRVVSSANKVREGHQKRYKKRSNRASAIALSNVVNLVQRQLRATRERELRESKVEALHKKVTSASYRSRSIPAGHSEIGLN